MVEETVPYALPAHRFMSARDIFGVIVRTLGLIIILYSVYCVFYWACAAAGSVATPIGRSNAALLAYAIFYGFVGAALLRGERLVFLAYGRERAL